MTPSNQVAWFEVYAYAQRFVVRHGAALDHRLIAGTPVWCSLPDDDPRKLLALVLGGVRDALRNDSRQEAMAEASHEIARATDCSALARRIAHGRGSAYIKRKVSP